MIDLSKCIPLGIGAHRSCYLHPDDKTRCIKVLHDITKEELRGIKYEMRYYRHINAYLKDWSGIPKYYGTVETSIGTGYVFEMILDYDGQPSCTLDKVMESCDSHEKAQQIVQLILRLKKYIRDNHILTMTLNPHNILYRRLSEDKTIPVICDNLGRNSIIPWSHWFQSVGDRSQEKRLKKFIKLPIVEKFLKRYEIDGSALIS